MRLYLYVVEHDKGFAPNPFYGMCTLAACKPQIRETAVVGDVISGFGSKPSGLSGRLIYWMKIDEILSFDEYWLDPRFRLKRPQMGGSLMQCYGDNIYHRNEANGEWIQEESFHSDPSNIEGGGNLRRDTERTQKVLIGRKFTYWGAAGPVVPIKFAKIVPFGRFYRCRLSEPDRDAFGSWLCCLPERGFISEPADWSRINLTRTKHVSQTLSEPI